jgi:hypothetical protein
MRLNLNNYILNSKTYLDYFHLKHDDSYNTFISDYDVKLHPYIYTFNKSKLEDKMHFMIFYKNYLDRSNIEYNFELDNIFDVISKDIVLTITFIIAIQYYFL